MVTHVHVHGHRAFTEDVPVSGQFLSLVTDFFIASCVLEITNALGISTIWDWKGALIGSALFYLAISTVSIFLTGRTAGQKLWSIRRIASTGESLRGLDGFRLYFSSPLKTLPNLSAGLKVFRVFCLFFFLVSALLIRLGSFQFNPLWKTALIRPMEAFAPTKQEDLTQWRVIPFYYTIGVWPKNILTFQIPYERGLPFRFLGHVEIILDIQPPARIILDGPTTPNYAFSREKIKNCFTKPFYFFPTRSCFNIRKQILSRYPIEKGASLEWFEVHNSSIPPESSPEGLYYASLHTSTPMKRFLVITPPGAIQAFTLITTGSEADDALFINFQKTIASLQVFPDLLAGLAWIEKELSEVKLDRIKQTHLNNPEEFLRNLSEIQGLLIARISTNPKDINAYFHLAGTLLMTIQKSSGNSKFYNYAMGAADNLRALSQYVEDIDPKSPKSKSVQTSWAEAKKILRLKE